MRLIRLIAQGALTYQGRTVGTGEVFEAAPIDAAVLTYHRQAIFATGTTPASPVPLDVRQQIERAVDAGIVVTAPGERVVPRAALPPTEPQTLVVDVEPEKPKRRRSYRRRDLRAED
jgi:hypothetical protein